MGRYLNSSTSYVLYKGQTEQPYFVDKSQMLSELFPFLDSGNTHICITRPRRFGKTVMANMITAFLGKKQDSDSIFKSLKISQNDLYNKYRNQYNVISIDFSKMPRDCDSYTDYIDRIETNLIRDLRKEYPQIEIYEDDSAADVLETIFEECDQQRFVFVLDEWDFIFHKDFVTEENKKQYVLFLSNLLKDRSYVQLTYMTGILPIAKYSSGSELNMFWEYTMASEAKYNEYFGFTDSEVDHLYEKYTRNTREIHISREDLKEWYDGYTTKSGERMYNPRSVVLALTNNNIGNYWTSSGPYDEIFSAMIVYGFLSYENGEVRIPNKELMNKFDDMIHKASKLKAQKYNKKKWRYVQKQLKKSKKILYSNAATQKSINSAKSDLKKSINKLRRK